MAAESSDDRVMATINKATEMKNEGNKLFGAGDLKGALFKWHSAQLQLKSLADSPLNAMTGEKSKVNPEQRDQANILLSQVLSNMALVQIKEQRYEKAIESCTSAIKYDPKAAKAYFRRGQTYLILRDTDRAESDLKKANELSPGDAGIAAELQKLKKLQAIEDSKQKKAYQNIFKSDD